jgi:hypothetical protein
MSVCSVPEQVARKQHAISAKLDKEAKRLLALEALERGITQSQIVIEAISGKPQMTTPVTGAAREIVMLCHHIRCHLDVEKDAVATSVLTACLNQLVVRLPALFELVRHERAR